MEKQSHIQVFDQEATPNFSMFKLNQQDISPCQDKYNLGTRYTNLSSGFARAMEEIPEEKDENSPPKKPNIKPRQLKFKREPAFVLPKREAKRLYTSLIAIDSKITSENSSSLNSQTDNRNPFSRASNDDVTSRASNRSRSSSYYNFENKRQNLIKLTRAHSRCKSSERLNYQESSTLAAGDTSACRSQKPSAHAKRDRSQGLPPKILVKSEISLHPPAEIKQQHSQIPKTIE